MRWFVAFFAACAVVGAMGVSAGRARAGINDDFILKRGDANSDGTVDVSDSAYITNWLFSGGSAPPCANQADVNNDGAVNVSDPIYLNNYLFQGGSAPPAPGPFNEDCTTDDYPYPGCDLPPCSITLP